MLTYWFPACSCSLSQWTAYTYCPVSLLLTSGGLMPAAWNAQDKRQTPDTKLTDVPASVKMGLEVAESLPAGSGEDCLCWRALTDCAQGWAVRKQWWGDWGYLGDDLSVTGGLRLRGATDDDPPPLLPSTRRGLPGWRPGHSDWLIEFNPLGDDVSFEMQLV